MTNLNELKIVNVESDTESGFFWVEFEGGKSLQCCLDCKQDDCDSEWYFVEQIDVSDMGYTDGLCGDCNSWAVDFSEDCGGEWGHIWGFLIDQARSHGVAIVS